MNKLMKRSQRLLHYSMYLLFFFFIGCDSSDDVQPSPLSTDKLDEAKPNKTSIYYGPATRIGGGTARVWVETVQGKPTAIGVEISAGLMATIESTGMFDIALKLPGQAHATGYKTITLGWNPKGHPPFPMYQAAHFDFHFYMQTEGQIRNIQGGVDPGAITLMNKGVMPETYSFGEAPVAAPHMGVHWVDLSSEEWVGFPNVTPGAFTKTFIYGSHKDRVTFLEPMITLSYLRNPEFENAVIPIPQLLIHEDPGYYPQNYSITRNSDGSYSIALIDLEWHNRNR